MNKRRIPFQSWIRKIIFIKYFILIPTFCFSYQNSNLSYIFSPNPVHIFSFDQELLSNVVLAKNTKTIAVNSMKESIFIIDSSYTQRQYNLTKLNSQPITSIGLSSNGQHIFVGMGNYIYICQIQLIQDDIQLVSTYDLQLNQVKDFIFNDNEKMMIILTFSNEIKCFNISDLKNINLIGSTEIASRISIKGITSTYDTLLYLISENSGLSVYFLQNDQNNTQLVINQVYSSNPGGNLVDFSKTQNDYYIYAVDSVKGLYIFFNMTYDQVVQNKNNKTQTNFKYFGLGNLNTFPSCFSIAITPSDSHIFIGVRSQGIFIFDIQLDPLNPILFQKITSDGHALRILIYFDTSAIIFSNSISLKIYEKQSANIQTYYPHLFNYHKKKQLANIQGTPQGKCFVNETQKIVYGTFNQSQIHMYQYIIQKQNSIGYFSTTQSNFIQITQDISLPTNDQISNLIQSLNISSSPSQIIKVNDFIITSSNKLIFPYNNFGIVALVYQLQSNQNSLRVLLNNVKINPNLQRYSYLKSEPINSDKKFQSSQNNNNNNFIQNVQIGSIQQKDEIHFLDQQLEDYSFQEITQIKTKNDNSEMKRTLNSLQPQFIQSISDSQLAQYTSIDLSYDERLIVISQSQGFILIDSATFIILNSYYLQNVTSICINAIFSQQNNFVLLIYQNIGLFVIDISNIFDPFLANIYYTSGGVQLIRSSISNYIYFIDGFKGLIIIDSTILPEIKVIGHYGYDTHIWYSSLSLSSEENIAFLLSSDENSISLIDIKNKANPYLLSIQNLFDNENDQIYSMCIDNTNQIAFEINQKGLFAFPTNSNLIIHVQLISLTQFTPDFNPIQNMQSNKLNSNNDQNLPLLVGWQYEFALVPLYLAENQRLKQLFYWNNNQLDQIPNWINATFNFEYLKLFIPKESIPESRLNGTLTIVIQSCFQISSKSLSEQLNTTLVSSSLLLSYLKRNQIIGQDNCLHNLLDSLQDDIQEGVVQSLNLTYSSFSDEQISNLTASVYEILKNSMNFTPIIFNVQKSLDFDLSNTQNMIQAPLATDITMVLYFQQDSGLVFVNRNYDNTYVSLVDQISNSIRIESALEFVNSILFQKIFYFINENNNQAISNSTSLNQTIDIFISDRLNYNVNLVVQIEQATFLKQKTNLVLMNPLQSQVNFLSSDASFPIETQLSIDFEKNTFVDPDSTNLSDSNDNSAQSKSDINIRYTLYTQNSDGEYSIVSSNYFLKFDSNNLRIVGSPPSSLLFTSQRYKIVAKTGYCTASDTFYLEFNQIPFSIILNVILKYIGPIAFLIELYLKRHIFVNLMNKQKVMYSQEKAILHQIYRKKITLIGDEIILTELFFEKFIKIIGKPTSQLYQEILNQQSIISLQSQQNQSEFPKQFLAKQQNNLSYSVKTDTNSPSQFLRSIQKKSLKKGIKTSHASLNKLTPPVSWNSLPINHRRASSIHQQEKHSIEEAKSNAIISRYLPQNTNQQSTKEIKNDNKTKQECTQSFMNPNKLQNHIQNETKEKVSSNIQNDQCNDNTRNKKIQSKEDSQISQTFESKTKTYQSNQIINRKSLPLHSIQKVKETLKRYSLDEVKNDTKSQIPIPKQQQILIQTKQPDSKQNISKKKINFILPYQQLEKQTEVQSELSEGEKQNIKQNFKPSFDCINTNMNMMREAKKKDTFQNQPNSLLVVEGFKNVSNQSFQAQSGNSRVSDEQSNTFIARLKNKPQFRDRISSIHNRIKQLELLSYNQNIQSEKELQRELKQAQKFFHQKHNVKKNNLPLELNRVNSDHQLQNEKNKTITGIGEEKEAKDAYKIMKNICISENGNLHLDQIVHHLIRKNLEVTHNLKKYYFSKYQNEFQNKESRFFYSLKSCVTKYLIQREEKTLYLFRYIKRLAKQRLIGQYSKNDWYKNYVHILPTNELDPFGIPIPFSHTELKYEILQNIIKDLNLFNPLKKLPQNEDGFNDYIAPIEAIETDMANQLKAHNINFYLLKEYLYSHALGLLLKKKHFLQQKYCYGESLHIKNHQLLSIQAFQEIKDSNCYNIRKYFNLVYRRIPISKHLSLPSWIQYDCKNGVLYLEGIPSHQDVSNMLIRVYDTSSRVILSFLLSVKEELSSIKSNQSFPNSNLLQHIKANNFQDNSMKQIQSQPQSSSLFTQKNSMNSINQFHPSKNNSFFSNLSINHQRSQFSSHYSNEDVELSPYNKSFSNRFHFNESSEGHQNKDNSSAESNNQNEESSISQVVFWKNQYQYNENLTSPTHHKKKKPFLLKQSSFRVEQNNKSIDNNQFVFEERESEVSSAPQLPNDDDSQNIVIPDSLTVSTRIQNKQLNDIESIIEMSNSACLNESLKSETKNDSSQLPISNINQEDKMKLKQQINFEY